MLIIDGNNLLHRLAIDRVGYGVHPVRQLYNRLCSPADTTVVVWDGPSANKRRKDLFKGYKANRRPKEESKYQFFDIAKGVLRFTPCIQVEIPGWEADDVIGTLINRYHESHNITVETNDGDYWQHKDKCHLPLISKKWHSFTAEDCVLYKTLVGDAKDGIPGLKGFGEKSWLMMPRVAKDRLLEAIRSRDYELFVTIEGWPSRVKIGENSFQEILLYWELNSCWSVPTDEIDSCLKPGKSNLMAAEIFMEKFLI